MTPRPAATARVTTDNLNVRVAPRTDAPVLGLLQPEDVVAIAGRSVDQRWLAIRDTGWVFYDREWIDLQGGAQIANLPEIAENELVGPSHPPSASTGFPAVDQVVSAVLSGSADTLVRLSEILEVRCAVQPGLGGPPPCPAGTPANTVIPVFPFASCEGEHIPPERLRESYERWLSPQAPGAPPARLSLYALVRAEQSGSSEYFPNGEYRVIFQFPSGEGRMLRLTAQGIVGAWHGCNSPAWAMLRITREDTQFLLRPVVPDPLDPPP